ncbi:RNA polymerase II elongation factor [Erysiphe neolycopersici]|uniref:RNA polymerase II elongation factor n=1 Tax=Erysiphe neolycopersici TaxID=212602 RepID=A0A420I183_9PEZI|nr:RNA polymerase II elongation factor [Erysiphe neolycopersici]
MSSCKNIEATLRSDFKCMRVLATCSICDQLLYEPWTIACGHTYCYSCLCSWFSQDKRKKSCPECRLRVKVMPAPSFLIKQLVEVILKRSELLLADESVEQHEKKRAEEITMVDNDRNSSKGLFKGMFALKQNRLWRDNTDGVLRCYGCGFEHEGGPLCSNCGEEIEIEEDFDDFDDDVEAAERETMELESMGFDLGQESDEDELFDFHDYHRFQSVSSFIDMTYTNRMVDSINHFRSHRDRGEVGLMAESDSEGTELSEASDSSESEDDNEDDSSLQGFIARDDENPGDDYDVYDDDDYSYEATTNITYNNHHISQSSSARQRNIETIIDDESDEGGAISNRRQRRRQNNAFSNIEALGSNQSVITVTDTSSNESEISDHRIDAEVLRQAGWSPLHQDNESDKQNDMLQNINSTPYASQDDGDSDTNTETLVDRNMSDGDDDDEDDDDGAQMENCDHSRIISIYESSSVLKSPQFYEFSESSNSQSMDEDRDVEMSDYRISRTSQFEKTSPTSYENRVIDTRIPYTEDIYRRTRSGNSGTRRKRPAWDSSSQDAPEMDSVDTNLSSRRSIARAIMRMHNNHRENRQASPARTEVISSRQENHDNCNLHTETIGLTNVIYEDVESDDSIQPPSRRHLRPRSSHISLR